MRAFCLQEICFLMKQESFIRNEKVRVLRPHPNWWYRLSLSNLQLHLEKHRNVWNTIDPNFFQDPPELGVSSSSPPTRSIPSWLPFESPQALDTRELKEKNLFYRSKTKLFCFCFARLFTHNFNYQLLVLYLHFNDNYFI